MNNNPKNTATFISDLINNDSLTTRKPIEIYCGQHAINPTIHPVSPNQARYNGSLWSAKVDGNKLMLEQPTGVYKE